MNEVSLTKEERHQKFVQVVGAIEGMMKKMPGVKVGHEMDDELCPLKHSFADGMYVREIFMPAGIRITSKIHKCLHPYFILKGKCSVLTENGIEEIEAPFYGFTNPGTKRVIIVREDTIWVTVHFNPTNTKDLEEIEARVIAADFNDPALTHKEEKCLGY